MSHIDRRIAPTALALSLLLAVAGLSACAEKPASTPGTSLPSADATEPADASAETTSAGTGGVTPTDDAATATGAAKAPDTKAAAVSPASTPSEITVQLYWVSAGENALGVPRTVPYTKAVARAAVNALLAGPTSAEKTTWPAISTAIPAGTRLLGIDIDDGVATVDLSREFDDGGGSFAMHARLAQVVYTLTQFSTIDAVQFRIEGVPVRVFSSEGIILDGPQDADDFGRLVPIDA